ncbi:MAG TPA: hypothetical protein VF275_03185, partial [Gammaproteobacteria bacterium]
VAVKEAPRQIPVQAMARCPDTLPTIPSDLPQMPVGKAMMTLITAVNASQREYFLCKAKQERLADWIE